MFTKSRLSKRIVTSRWLTRNDPSLSVTDRQELLPAFDQRVLEATTVVLIGAGGIGSEVGEGLVRKGIHGLSIFDHDTVEITNLNRQHFFRRDIHKSKAKRLAVNLGRHATCGTTLTGYSLSFQDALALGVNLDGHVVVCGVDDGRTRTVVSRYYQERGIPVVFIAVDYVAENGYVFVQEPGKACFGCAFAKSVLNPRKAPCRTPAVKDILKVVSGAALYAVDTLLMDRKRAWNYRNFHLAGFAPSNELMIQSKDDCPLCGKNGG